MVPSTTLVDERLDTSSPYVCRVKVEYDRDLLRLLDDGMLQNKETGETMYTLIEVVRFWPATSSLLMVQLTAIPINYDLVLKPGEDSFF